MNPRTSRKTITFTQPFSLRGIDGVQPPGAYTVETDEELIEGLSFLAYRRIATVMFLPPQAGGTIMGQIATVDPLELEAARARDSAGEERLPRY